MGRKHDPLDDFEVVPHNPTPEEDQAMREFIRKYKEEHPKKDGRKNQARKITKQPKAISSHRS